MNDRMNVWMKFSNFTIMPAMLTVIVLQFEGEIVFKRFDP